MNEPLVSIIIPVYNGSNFLAEAIDSALAQTYKNIEIVVVNDGSKDDGATEKVALSYGEKIRYIHKGNGGVSSALNLGIKEMHGEYFSWLSHDDLYEPNKVEKQVSLIKNENDIILCSGYLVDENKKRLPYKAKTLDGRFTGNQMFRQFLNGYALNGLGFLLPRDMFLKVGFFDETMRYLQDLDLWLRVMHFDYTFVCHSDLLVISRVHSGQQTNTISELFDVDRESLARKHFDILENETIENKKELYELYYLLFVKGNNKPGEKLFNDYIKSAYNETMIFRAIPYRAENIVKNTVRMAYNMVLKIKKQRN